MGHFKGGKNTIFKHKRLFFWVDVTLKNSKILINVTASLS